MIFVKNNSNHFLCFGFSSHCASFFLRKQFSRSPLWRVSAIAPFSPLDARMTVSYEIGNSKKATIDASTGNDGCEKENNHKKATLSANDQRWQKT